MRIRMKNRRLELKLSQQQVADLAGMTRGNYAHIERGRHEPNIEQMERIAKALQVKATIDFFKHDCDKMEQDPAANQ